MKKAHLNTKYAAQTWVMVGASSFTICPKAVWSNQTHLLVYLLFSHLFLYVIGCIVFNRNLLPVNDVDLMLHLYKLSIKISQSYLWDSLCKTPQFPKYFKWLVMRKPNGHVILLLTSGCSCGAPPPRCRLSFDANFPLARLVRLPPALISLSTSRSDNPPKIAILQ